MAKTIKTQVQKMRMKTYTSIGNGQGSILNTARTTVFRPLGRCCCIADLPDRSVSSNRGITTHGIANQQEIEQC